MYEDWRVWGLIFEINYNHNDSTGSPGETEETDMFLDWKFPVKKCQNLVSCMTDVWCGVIVIYRTSDLLTVGKAGKAAAVEL